jgi:uncharacterized protein
MSDATQCPTGQALNEEGKAAAAKGALKRARKTFLRGARLGHAGAQYNYGAMCFFGEGGRRDHPEAARWFRKAAEQGHEAAQSNLAGMQVMGMVAPGDPSEAQQMFLHGANQGDAFAQFNAGEMYATGEFVPKDLVEACKWLTLATTQGVVVALGRLAEIHLLLSPEQREVARQRIREFRARIG